MSHRNHRHSHHIHLRPRPPIFFGVVVLTFGVLFLLDNLNLIEARGLIRTYWPAVLVAWGAYHLVAGGPGQRFLGGTLAAVGGILLAGRLYGWNISVWDVIWPMVLIAFGIHILLVPRRLPLHAAMMTPPTPSPAVDAEPVSDRPEEFVDSRAFFHAAAVMAALQQKNVSQALQSGVVVAVMGSMEVDLRECRIASDEARIAVRVVMGEVILRVPRDWAVQSTLGGMLANAENKTSPPVDRSAKRLVVEGSVFMGNVEVTN